MFAINALEPKLFQIRDDVYATFVLGNEPNSLKFVGNSEFERKRNKSKQ